MSIRNYLQNETKKTRKFDENVYRGYAKDLMVDAYLSADIEPQDLPNKEKRKFARKLDLDPTGFIEVYDKMLKDGSWERIKDNGFI